MRYSNTHKAEVREQILVAAEKVLRLRGIDGVGIDAIMVEAGMTSGAFYSQFKSKKELLSDVLKRGFNDFNLVFLEALESEGLIGLVNAYLDEKHCLDIEGGCTIAALLCDLVRADRQTKQELNGHLKKMFEQFSQLFESSKEAEQGDAIAVLALLLGGIQMARASGDHTLTLKILEACKQYIIARL